MNIDQLYPIYLQHPKVVTDTRAEVKDSLFFCLKGGSFDGNQFANAALEQGAAYAIIDDPAMAGIPGTILVDDVLACLQQLAAHHRKQCNIPFIGITGTNGKTTTKELIAAVLARKYRVHATKGNLNNHIGVPLTLLNMPADTGIAIIEMGANHPGEIADLCEIALPDSGIITNIGKAHLEGFGSIDNIIETKTALYRSVALRMGTVFVNGGNPLLCERAKGIQTVFYGEGANSSVSAEIISSEPYLSVKWGEPPIETSTHLAGIWNLENIMAAICIGQYYQVCPEEISAGLSEYTPSNMRSQIKQTEHNTILLDAYNANPTSMRAAITHFGSSEAASRIVILGDMRELGEGADAEHQAILDILETIGFKKVMIVGEHFSAICRNPQFQCYANTADLKKYLQANPLQNEYILIKGSRGIGLEAIIEDL
jgi:UDP-N-acetylmuramoyl-tripeptide--D-alanyl-D-alanine ligase